MLQLVFAFLHSVLIFHSSQFVSKYFGPFFFYFIRRWKILVHANVTLFQMGFHRTHLLLVF